MRSKTPQPTMRKIAIRVMSHLGKKHLFDVSLPLAAPAGDMVMAVAERLGADKNKIVVTDLTDQVPCAWTAVDEEPMRNNRVVHVRPLLTAAGG